MSAIAKPLTFTPNSDAGAVSEVVNVEHIKDISKADIPARTENGKPRFVINITTLSTDNQPKISTWTYQTVATPDTARDTDFTALVALAATSL